MAISKQDARRTKHAVLAGDERVTPVLDGSSAAATVYNAEITGPTQKFTVQSTGNLAFTWAVSANGQNFGTTTSVAANALSTYSGPDVVAVVQITWVSGSGQVSLLAV